MPAVTAAKPGPLAGGGVEWGVGWGGGREATLTVRGRAFDYRKSLLWSSSVCATSIDGEPSYPQLTLWKLPYG